MAVRSFLYLCASCSVFDQVDGKRFHCSLNQTLQESVHDLRIKDGLSPANQEHILEVNVPAKRL